MVPLSLHSAIRYPLLLSSPKLLILSSHPGLVQIGFESIIVPCVVIPILAQDVSSFLFIGTFILLFPVLAGSLVFELVIPPLSGPRWADRTISTSCV